MALNFRFQFLGRFLAGKWAWHLRVWGLKTQSKSWPTLGSLWVTCYLKIVLQNFQTLAPLIMCYINFSTLQSISRIKLPFYLHFLIKGRSSQGIYHLSVITLLKNASHIDGLHCLGLHCSIKLPFAPRSNVSTLEIALVIVQGLLLCVRKWLSIYSFI